MNKKDPVQCSLAKLSGDFREARVCSMHSRRWQRVAWRGLVGGTALLSRVVEALQLHSVDVHTVLHLSYAAAAAAIVEASFIPD
jgi:hypothetical protein